MSPRPLHSIVRSLGQLSRRWLDPGYSFRKKALRRLVRRSGFSDNMAGAMLDSIFRELTEQKLWTLLKSELRDPLVLDGFRPALRAKKWVMARGPGRILHIFSANLPNATILSFVLGMLLKSRNIGKPSSRDEGFLGVYLESLKTVDRDLWRNNFLLDPADRKAISRHLKEADMVVAYGDDKNLERIRQEVPVATPFHAYGHKISLGLYIKEALTKKNVRRLAVLAARDVWMADQRGCLSPVTFYAQKGGEISPAVFAECLAGELRRLQKNERGRPHRDISSEASAFMAYSRSMVQKIKGKQSLLWQSAPRGFWAVSYEEDLGFAWSGASQVISIRGFVHLDRVFSSWKPLKKYLQCVSLECAAPDRKRLAEKLSTLGVNRICRAGQMQSPPVTWHHDARPNLANWVYWTDLEK